MPLKRQRRSRSKCCFVCAKECSWVLKVSLRWFLQYVSVNKIKSNPCTSPESHFQIFIIFQVHDSQSKFSFVSFSMFHLLIYQGHLASLLSSPPNQTFLPISQSILTLPQASHTPIMPINAGARSQRAALWPLLPAFRSVRNSVAQVCDRWALVEKLWPNKLQLSRGQCVREHWLWCYFWQGENQGRGDGSWRKTKETKVIDEVLLVNVMRSDLRSIDHCVFQDCFHLPWFNSTWWSYTGVMCHLIIQHHRGLHHRGMKWKMKNVWNCYSYSHKQYFFLSGRGSAWCHFYYCHSLEL